jgi:hypothetical protein
MSIRITCIEKDSGNHENPHVAISFLGWTNEANSNSGRTSRDDMYDWVRGGGEAYVRDSAGDVAYLIAEISPRGTKYVKTKPDRTKQDNLLKLKECI